MYTCGTLSPVDMHSSPFHVQAGRRRRGLARTAVIVTAATAAAAAGVRRMRR